MIKKPKEINTIIKTLESAGFDTYCAGQCVTDGLTGRESLEWDLYTECPQDKVRELFPEGEVLGSRTTRLDYSEEVISDDVNVPDRYDGVIADVVTLQGEMEEQLNVYDFTCEAIADHSEKALVDPWDGKNDIKRRLLRTTKDPKKMFGKDPIKMMKALKYVGLYGFDLSKDIYNAMNQQAGLLKKADKEELLYEFMEALNGDHGGKVMRMIKGLGLITAFIGDEGPSSDKRETKEYEQACENIDKLKHIALRRLAIFYLCFDRHYKKAVSYLPHEEMDLKFLLDAKEYLPKLYFAGDDTNLKKFIYRCGWDEYNFMDKLAKAQVIVFGYSDQKNIGRDEVLKLVLSQRQPIFLEDLRIDEDDIIEAGITNDWEKAHKLLGMVMDVVHQKPEKNERDQLLKYARAFSKNKLRAALRDVSWLR